MTGLPSNGGDADLGVEDVTLDGNANNQGAAHHQGVRLRGLAVSGSIGSE